MKLLLDENLPPALADALASVYPRTAHIRNVVVGLSTSDAKIWDVAKASSFVIVTKDADFSAFSTLFGQPLKVVLIALGNCTSAELFELLKTHRERLQAFATDSKAMLVLP